MGLVTVSIFFYADVTKALKPRIHLWPLNVRDQMSKESQNDHKSLSDEELMELYIASDYAAFETLYQRHSGRIFHYLKKKVGHEVAQDLLQETFSKIHRSRDKYKSQYPLLPWVFTIVRNLLTDHFRKNETQGKFVELKDQDEPHVEASLGGVTQLEQSLSILPSQQQRALKLRYLDDWSFEEIAKEINTTPQNARQLISRGLKKVRSYGK